MAKFGFKAYRARTQVGVPGTATRIEWDTELSDNVVVVGDAQATTSIIFKMSDSMPRPPLSCLDMSSENSILSSDTLTKLRELNLLTQHRLREALVVFVDIDPNVLADVERRSGCVGDFVNLVHEANSANIHFLFAIPSGAVLGRDNLWFRKSVAEKVMVVRPYETEPDGALAHFNAYETDGRDYGVSFEETEVLSDPVRALMEDASRFAHNLSEKSKIFFEGSFFNNENQEDLAFKITVQKDGESPKTYSWTPADTVDDLKKFINSVDRESVEDAARSAIDKGREIYGKVSGDPRTKEAVDKARSVVSNVGSDPKVKEAVERGRKAVNDVSNDPKVKEVVAKATKLSDDIRNDPRVKSALDKVRSSLTNEGVSEKEVDAPTNETVGDKKLYPIGYFDSSVVPDLVWDANEFSTAVFYGPHDAGELIAENVSDAAKSQGRGIFSIVIHGATESFGSFMKSVLDANTKPLVVIHYEGSHSEGQSGDLDRIFDDLGLVGRDVLVVGAPAEWKDSQVAKSSDSAIVGKFDDAVGAILNVDPKFSSDDTGFFRDEEGTVHQFSIRAAE